MQGTYSTYFLLAFLQKSCANSIYIIAMIVVFTTTLCIALSIGFIWLLTYHLTNSSQCKQNSEMIGFRYEPVSDEADVLMFKVKELVEKLQTAVCEAHRPYIQGYTKLIVGFIAEDVGKPCEDVIAKLRRSGPPELPEPLRSHVSELFVTLIRESCDEKGRVSRPRLEKSISDVLSSMCPN